MTAVLLLRNPACGHAIGIANLTGHHLLETNRVRLALAGHTVWQIDTEDDRERIAAAICLPWTPCGDCGRHDLIGTPHLITGGRP